MTRSKTIRRGRSWASLAIAAVLSAAVSLPTTTALAQDRDAPPSSERAKPVEERPPEATRIQIVGPVTLEQKRVPHAISDWREGEPIPAGYHPVERTRRGPIIAGAIVFGILYFFTAIGAGLGQDSGNSAAAMLYIPVAGPFMWTTQNSTATGNVFLVADGLGQAAGLTLFIWGLASPQTVLVRDDMLGVHVAPRPMLLGKSGGGFGLVGSF